MNKEKILQVRITTRKLETLTAFIREHPIELHEVGPRRDEKGLISVDAFVTEEDLELLKKSRLTFEVIADMTELGKRSQAEVGQEDRFDGGKRPPVRRRRG